MTAAEANTALEYYRERFACVGMYENSVYDGIPELLQNLRQAGKTLAVATSKPQLYAEKILEHFGLAAHFSTIAGPGFNGELPTKADVISEVLQRLHLTAADKNAAVMLGDREHDAIGAQQNKIAIIGAGYLAIGGTSVIIVVGVALETVKALENQMLMRQYKGFLE